jgi:endonuclease/exonuclease/phosphatase family metal-dependent hydrolase
MRNLRIMTMNIQCQAWPAGPHSDAKRRAKKVVETLTSKDFDWDNHPDIVVFNEADNETAKDVLREGLKDIYPHHILSFNGNSWDMNDGGLAIFSKFPFVKFNQHDQNQDDDLSRFYPYATKVIFQPMSSGSDGLAEKGVALVKVSTGLHFEEVILAFTHLQAFYEECGENFEIRLRQLKVIEQALIDLIGLPENNDAWNKVVVLGDLNIWGDEPPLSTRGNGEWSNIFLNNGGNGNAFLWSGLFNRIGQLIFTEQFVDGWSHINTLNGNFKEADTGYTNTNLVGGDNLPAMFKSRLDYICFPKERMIGMELNTRRLVGQYMRILPTGYSPLDLAFTSINSDHKALLTQIHWDFPMNTPAQAKRQGDFHPHDINGTGAKLQVANDFNIPSPGVFQWIYIDKPGTYTFNMTEGIEATYYFEDQVSVAINPYRKIKVTELGLENIEAYLHEFQLSETSDQVDIHKPMFICLKANQNNDQFTGRFSFSFIRHTGEIRGLAIGLEANAPLKDPMLPKGQDNGKNDDCWFRMPLPVDLFSGQPYPVTVVVTNDFRKLLRLELFDSIHNQVAFHTDSGKSKKFMHEFDKTNSIHHVFMNLKREVNTDVEFLAGYRYAISYLNHLSIYCEDDQSGLGADEIHLTGTVDGGTKYFIDFKDNDFSDDELRVLNHKIPVNLAFLNSLDLTVFEMDAGFDDDGPFNATILSLRPNENQRETSFIIHADGAEYRIDYKLSRLPNRV